MNIIMKSFPLQFLLLAVLCILHCPDGFSQNRVKKTDYEYDLISGNVKQVTYQAGRPETYVQQYVYDADNRITEVRSSSDGVIFNRDAAYTYYQHGPVARTLIGDNKVQGLDYTYTLQGWIKGVNSNVMDMVKDPGKDGQLSTKTGRDVFSYSLSYYNGDYVSIAGSMQFLATVNSNNLDAANSGLFNGNIRHMVTSLTDNNGVQMEGQGYAYRYDQMNRIKKSEMFLLNKSTNGFGTGPSALYRETFAYDANGNISGLTRNGNNSIFPQMDQLSYAYAQEGEKKLNNRLLHVDDGIVPERYETDFDDQGEFVSNDPATWNYQYDAIGNLIKDKKESIEEITWTVTGKIKSIHRVSGSTLPDMEFRYDALGHRIAKIEKPSGHLNEPSQWTYTYYVLDMKGNQLAVYVKKPEGGDQRIKLKDQYVYVTERLGNIQRDMDVTDPFLPMPNATPTFERVLGKKQYELTNHLGNVLEVITDKRNVQRNAGGAVEYYHAQVVSAADYYVFGSLMPGRDANSSNYRFGFNGMEKDDEMKSKGNSYDFEARIYDPRISRFLTIDPEAKTYPMWTPYCFAANSPLRWIDEDGKGPKDRIQKGISFLGIPYHQDKGKLRFEENTEALAHLDCSEYVTRVMMADGILPSGSSYNTAGLIKYFNENPDKFVNTKTDPQPGDIYLYVGHTGIVESVEKLKKSGKTKIHTIEAEGIDRGSTRSSRVIEDLAAKKGDDWKGFFRPVIETPEGKIDGSNSNEVVVTPSATPVPTSPGMPNVPAPRPTREENKALQSLPDRGQSLKKNYSEPPAEKVPKPKKLFSGG